MLIAFLLVTFASLLWGITNHVDKYLISKISKNGDYKGLLIFSSLIAGVILIPISLIITKLNVSTDVNSFIIIFFSATAYLIATAFYLKALNKSDASIVIAMFQLIPLFSYFLGLIFLNEILSLKEILGGIIIVISSITITFEFDSKKFNKTKLTALALMLGSSLMYAVYFLLFRITTLNNSFDIMTFWYQIALSLNGLLIFSFVKSYRKAFIMLVKENGRKVFGFNVINEGINIVANMLVNYSITLAPMAVVLTLNGLQPFFVFLIGVIGTITLPKIFNEDITIKVVLQKAICIVLSIIGLAILYM